MPTLPSILTSGDSLNWEESIDNFSPLDWNLTILIRGEKKQLDLVGIANDDTWLFALDTKTSSLLDPGKYWAQYVVFNDVDRKTLETVELTVNPSFAQLKNYDGRHPDEIELEQVGLAIATVANDGISEYEINGRKVRYQDLSELIRLRDKLRVRIAKRNNQGKSRNAYISFR